MTLGNLNQPIRAVATRAGGALDQFDSLVDVVLPAPGPPTGHELLVKVEAVSVNPVDIKLRAGGGHGQTGRILGWDAVGTVEATGAEAERFTAGDRVWYAGAINRPGSNAEYQLVDEYLVGHAPATLNPAQAAALPLTGLTAWEALFDKLKLETCSAGTILVLGAAGGVGSVLIQLAKALTKLRVIATASRPQSRAWVTDLGADLVIDHFTPDLADQILALAPGGVDYVFTPQTAGRVALFTEVVRPFGEIVAIDDESDIDLYALKAKALSWHWEFMFARSMHQALDRARQGEILNRLAALVDAGTVRSTASTILHGLTAATLRQAHAILETGHNIGKVVIDYDPPDQSQD
jgi:zinc-binding alcohol dehydrogenase family protein